MFLQSFDCHLQPPLKASQSVSQSATLAATQSIERLASQQVRYWNRASIRGPRSQQAPPPVPANLVRNQLRLCLPSSPCLQLICFPLMQLSCVLRAERHNKVIRLIRLAAPLLSPYAHYTYSIRCVMRFCTPSTRCRFARARAGECTRLSRVCVSERASVLAEEICSIYILSLA